MANKLVPYTDTYIEQCFQAWYQIGCPPIKQFFEHVPKDELGRTPNITTIEAWANERKWFTRRDALDARAYAQVEESLVQEKVLMLKEQAEAFSAIRKKASEFLLAHDFDTSASAVSALVKSSQEERKVRGISSVIERLATMNDEELYEEIKKLTDRVGEIEPSDIIDMGEETGEENGDNAEPG